MAPHVRRDASRRVASDVASGGSTTGQGAAVSLGDSRGARRGTRVAFPASMERSATDGRGSLPRIAHPGWLEVVEGWHRAGIARELDPAPLASYLVDAPTAPTIGMVLSAHYHAGGDTVEHAWRAQSDRFLELPDEPLAPELLAAATHVIVPDVRVEVSKHESGGVELRLVNGGLLGEPAQQAAVPSVLLRRVRQHARSRAVQARPIDGLEPRSFVYALNVLLEEQRAALRFVPVAAAPGRRAWLGATLPQAYVLAEHGTLASDERWYEYARFSDPGALALAS